MVWFAAALSIITDLAMNTTINRSVHPLSHPHTSPLSSSSSLSFHERFILANSAPLAYCVSLFPHLNACNYVITVKVMWAEQSSLHCNSPFPQ
ncbi:unnamed protein product [Musa acuminata var. zebrina]